MGQVTINALTARCHSCGAFFDFSYDLKGVSEERLLSELLHSSRYSRRFLCWECRIKKRY